MDVENRTLSGTASASGVSAHGDGLGLLLDILEELEGTGEFPAVDGLGGLAGVLERNTEVGTASAGGLGRLDFGGGVTDLLVGEKMVRMVFLQVFLQQEFLQEFSQSRRWWMTEK